LKKQQQILNDGTNKKRAFLAKTLNVVFEIRGIEIDVKPGITVIEIEISYISLVFEIKMPSLCPRCNEYAFLYK
jgi:hypothetical protein